MDHESFVKSILSNVDGAGRLKSRERHDLEFKQSFNVKKMATYAKTMTAFANNQGGYILFGVKDNPREPVGVNELFLDIDVAKITEAINSLFSPELLWDTGTISFNSYLIGYIYTHESFYKPVIALKNENVEKINSGDVFYRYRGRTEKIKYPEMRKIIVAIEKKEREGILKLVEMIRKSDTTNLGIINYSTGNLTTPYGVDVSIEKKLILQVLKKAKFIKSGSFDETMGTPVLKVTGSIDLAEEIPVSNVDPDIQYPYLQKNLAKKLSVSPHQIYALIWYFEMKGKKKFHLAISVSNANKIHKFSEVALQYLKQKISDNKENPHWLEEIVISFNQFKKK